MTIYTAMLTGPENMPVFGDNQLTPDQKAEIINYVQTLKAQADPGGAGIGRARPGQRGPGHLGRRHRRAAVRHLLDGEQGVTHPRQPPRLDRRRRHRRARTRADRTRTTAPSAGDADPRASWTASARATTAWRSCTSSRAPSPARALEQPRRAPDRPGLRAGRRLRLRLHRHLHRGRQLLPAWQWAAHANGFGALFTPLLGACMGLSLVFVGAGHGALTKKLLPHETAVQDKHDGSHFDRVDDGRDAGRRTCDNIRAGPAAS